jgi:hypothetical protein
LKKKVLVVDRANPDFPFFFNALNRSNQKTGMPEFRAFPRPLSNPENGCRA